MLDLALFRRRNFAVGNIATVAIYAALTAPTFLLTVFLQQVAGYAAIQAGLALLPVTIIMFSLSPLFGRLAAKHGSRLFMTAGPIVAAVGFALMSRVEAEADYVTQLLPGVLVFGLGLASTVAPLTQAILGDIDERHAGIGSAINNAIADVGPQLINAVVFVAITASFYASLGTHVPGLDTSASRIRQQISPLNRPAQGVPAQEAAAARQASADAFHVAMMIGAVLLLGGAAVNAAGIRNEAAAAPRG